MTEPAKILAPEFALDARSGWPADLRLLIDRYPREVWAGHANLGAMAQFWLSRHDMFREIGGGAGRGDKRVSRGQRRAERLPRLVSGAAAVLFAAAQRASPDRGPAFLPGIPGGGSRLAHGFDVLESDHKVIHEQIVATVEQANAFLRTAAQRRCAARGGRALRGGERCPAAPADAAPWRRGRPDHPAHPRPQRGGARRGLTDQANQFGQAAGNLVHRHARPLRIAMMALTSVVPSAD